MRPRPGKPEWPSPMPRLSKVHRPQITKAHVNRSKSATRSKPSGSTRPLDKMTRERAGKRSYTRTDRKRGRYIKARPAGDHPEDIAFDATLRAAAPYQRQRHATKRERPCPPTAQG